MTIVTYSRGLCIYKPLFLLLCFLTLLAPDLHAQSVSINNTGAAANASAMLDVSSTTKGILIPRMTLAQRTAMNPLPAAAQGLMVYQTDAVEGFYYNTSITTTPNWIYIFPGGAGSAWALTGNAGTTVGTNFIGTTDTQPLMFRVNNQKAGFIDYDFPYNTGFGYQTLKSITSGNYNTANGYQALYSTTTGSRNTANGYQALYVNTDGYYNTANGFAALYANTIGHYNTANGYAALYSNTSGNFNTANGQGALYYNTTGNENTAYGYAALNSNTTAGQNTAIGNGALLTQTFSNSNTLWNSDNVAVGYEALYYNQPTSTANGINNTAVGTAALRANTTGSGNTALGSFADVTFNNLTNATAIGYYARVATSNSLVLGGTGTYAVNVGIGTPSPQAKLHVNAGDASLALFGPNISGGNLYVGAAPNQGVALTAQVLASDGNLHIDPAPGKNIYLGYYQARDMYLNPNGGKVGIGTASPAATLEVNGYTKLGTDAPSVKFKKLTGTTSASSGGATYIAHGLDATKILSVSVTVQAGTTFWVGPNLSGLGYNFYWSFNQTLISIDNFSGDSFNILLKPIKILITYEE